jgi:hypothetical protein
MLTTDIRAAEVYEIAISISLMKILSLYVYHT